MLSKTAGILTMRYGSFLPLKCYSNLRASIANLSAKGGKRQLRRGDKLKENVSLHNDIDGIRSCGFDGLSI